MYYEFILLNYHFSIKQILKSWSITIKSLFLVGTYSLFTIDFCWIRIQGNATDPADPDPPTLTPPKLISA